MDWFMQFGPAKLLLVGLIAARMGGLTVVAPICGARDVPLRFRVVLALALAVLVAPTQWAISPPRPDLSLHCLVLAGSELLIGAFFGLALVFLFSGVQMAGGLLGRLGGLTLSDVFDPSANEPAPLLGRFLYLLALVVFFAVGGHRMALGALLDTFRSLPPGCMASPGSMAHVLQQLLTQSFATGLRIAAPVIVAVLLATVVVGVVGRTLPQMNFLTVGFGLNSMLGLGLLAIALGAGAMVFQSQIDPTLDLVRSALDLAGP
jgi:flagellar biosynthesis protein FliR